MNSSAPVVQKRPDLRVYSSSPDGQVSHWDHSAEPSLVDKNKTGHMIGCRIPLSHLRALSWQGKGAWWAARHPCLICDDLETLCWIPQSIDVQTAMTDGTTDSQGTASTEWRVTLIYLQLVNVHAKERCVPPHSPCLAVPCMAGLAPRHHACTGRDSERHVSLWVSPPCL